MSNFSSQSQSWPATATKLKDSFNTQLWDSAASLYRDNSTTSLHLQDGNALALLFSLTESPSQAALVSGPRRELVRDEPPCPELPDTTPPFVSGIEVLGHSAANELACSLELIRRLWSYMLDALQFTGSTLVEGLSANGSLYYRSSAGCNGDASYTSLSHGWSSAPTQALTMEVVGLKIVEMGGRRWFLSPKLGKFEGRQRCL
ncbi:MAG: hypothetical protein M1822_005999 [Bathelium mastoideum]|nr:MAG: hypothetical protein M1822_005999 [Bathelium mastoideum]